MTVCVLILYTELWQPMADIVLPNIRAYCDKHGYDYQFMQYPEPYPSNFGFNKLIEILDLFKLQRHDVIWSLDLDATITNHNIKVEQFLDDEHDFFITRDVNGINAGSFLVRNTAWAKEFMEYLVGFKDVTNCEQDAIDLYMVDNECDKIKVLEHPSINSYNYELYPEHGETRKREEGHWHDGDFVLHLPGIGVAKRLEILSNTPIIK